MHHCARVSGLKRVGGHSRLQHHCFLVVLTSAAGFACLAIRLRSEFIAGLRGHIRDGGQVFLEILAAAGGGFAPQVGDETAFRVLARFRSAERAERGR